MERTNCISLMTAQPRMSMSKLSRHCLCFKTCCDIAFVLKIVVTLPLFGKLVFQPQTSVSPFFVSAIKRMEARHKPLKCPQTGFSGYWGFLKVVERTRRTCQVPTCASLTLASSFSICTLLPIFTLSELSFQKCHFTEPSWTSCSTGLALGGLGCWWQASCLNSAPYFERQLLGAHQAAPSDQAAVSMWHPAKTTGQQPPQNNNVQNCLQFLKNNFGHIDCCFRREDQMRTLSTWKTHSTDHWWPAFDWENWNIPKRHI